MGGAPGLGLWREEHTNRFGPQDFETDLRLALRAAGSAWSFRGTASPDRNKWHGPRSVSSCSILSEVLHLGEVRQVVGFQHHPLLERNARLPQRSDARKVACQVPWYYDERWHQRSSSAKLHFGMKRGGQQSRATLALAPFSPFKASYMELV